ncbi:hypothetical protein [Cryobacterium sp. M96]|uniref:hypothetical protein n=1 Tax=Cryobacterium sp. M96 TaxID=2048295 RepID=UPI0018EE1D51|nr:hypothetical protein [Cryobacterium sp. M96]
MATSTPMKTSTLSQLSIMNAPLLAITDTNETSDNPGSSTTGGNNHAVPDRPAPSNEYAIKGYKESNGGFIDRCVVRDVFRRQMA